MAIRALGPALALRISPESPGLRETRTGLTEGEVIYEVSGEHSAALAVIPKRWSVHPFSNYVWMESRDIQFMPWGVRAMCRYAGADPLALNIPVYNLVVGMEEAPIETHPLFTNIGGTPSSPLNGAIFLDPETNLPGNDNARCFFDRFPTFLADGSKNLKAGIESFLEPVVSYREEYVTTSLPSLTGFGKRTTTVPGPGLPGGLGKRDWLYLGYTYTRRGNQGGSGPFAYASIIYEVTHEWRLSGRNGWDPDIYA